MHKKVEQSVNSYTEFEKLAWGSDQPIPAVGSEVNVKINGIGRSKGWTSIPMKPYSTKYFNTFDPPAWYIKQNGADEPCHVYPAECEELQVRKSDGTADKNFYESLHNSMA